MKSTENRDIFLHSDANLARLNRIAADTAWHNPYWTDREREERAKHYEAEAARHERRAS